MSHDDDYGFWDDDRSKPLSGRRARPQRAVRQHSLHSSASLERDSFHRHSSAASLGRPSTLLWSRVGLLGLVGVLAISVALATSSQSSLPRAAAAATEAAQSGDRAVVVASPVVAVTVLSSVSPAEVATTTTAVTQAPVEAVTSVKAPAKVAPSCAHTYNVVALDYWILIAKKVSVSLKDLLAANNARTSTALFPGRTVCLPANASAPTTVKPTPTTVKAVAAKVIAPKKAVAKSATTTTTVKASSKRAKQTPSTQPVESLPPSRSYSAAEVEQIIRDVWPDEIEDHALLIARRESGLRPTARNRCCSGLFQIYYLANQKFLVSIGVTSAGMLLDPVVNANAAYAMYVRSGGWGPWS